jgi:hypothetical protein
MVNAHEVVAHDDLVMIAIRPIGARARLPAKGGRALFDKFFGVVFGDNHILSFAWSHQCPQHGQTAQVRRFDLFRLSVNFGAYAIFKFFHEAVGVAFILAKQGKPVSVIVLALDIVDDRTIRKPFLDQFTSIHISSIWPNGR